jgi:hypothetical protein
MELKSAIRGEELEVNGSSVNVKVPDQWHTLLHRLWSKAVGAPDYVKAEWIELENILFQAAAKLVHKETEKKRSAAAGSF